MLAGSQADSGLYVVDQFASYAADEVFDRAGHRIPVGLDLDAWSNPIGFQVTFKLSPLSMYINVAAAAPIAHVSLQTDQPEASVDEFYYQSALPKRRISGAAEIPEYAVHKALDARNFIAQNVPS